VSDDVVQLAGDAGSLLGDGSAGFGSLLPFELPNTLCAQPETTAQVPHDECHDEPEPNLNRCHPFDRRAERDHGEGATQSDGTPPIVGGVSANAVQRNQHRDPD
jgi:hypothetical protein